MKMPRAGSPEPCYTSPRIRCRYNAITPNEERWAEALILERLRSHRAFEHIAERLIERAHSGDEAGVRRWRGVAARLEQLLFDGKLQS